MFFGRDAELQELNDDWKRPGFHLPVVYGRRRVGKTALLNQFCIGKGVLFFTPTINHEENIIELKKLVRSFGIDTHGETLRELFEDIFRKSVEKRFVFIVDEYPYLEETKHGVTSTLQFLIDKYSTQSKLFLVLCGSSMSFMKNQILGYNSPIFGRRTKQILVEPFSVFESSVFLPQTNFQNLCEIYGMVDGTPQYLMQICDGLSFQENLEECFLNPARYLFEESDSLLKQELQTPRLYSHLLEIIGSKALKLNKIADQMLNYDIDKTHCFEMIEKLIDIGILKELVAVGEKGKRLYQIDDCYFRFWHTFIPKVKSAVKSRQEKEASRFIVEHYPEYMGGVFEKICGQWLLEESRKENLPVKITSVDKWWGNDTHKMQQAEIDIVASNLFGNTIFAECKWRNEKMDIVEIDKLIHRSKFVKKQSDTQTLFYFFSKGGFTEGCLQRARENPAIKLVDLPMMFSQDIREHQNLSPVM